MMKPQTLLPSFALLTLLAIPSSAFAQRMYTLDELVQSPSVQRELQLTRAQINQLDKIPAKIEKFFEKERARYSFDEQTTGAAGEKQRAEMKLAQREIALNTERYVTGLYTEVLLDFQWARLKQISLRKSGSAMLSFENVQAKLDLTVKQIAELKSKREESFKALEQFKRDAFDRALENGIRREWVAGIWNAIAQGPRELDYVFDELTEEEIEKVDAMKEDYEAYDAEAKDLEESLFNILTNTQKRQLEKMLGEELEE